MKSLILSLALVIATVDAIACFAQGAAQDPAATNVLPYKLNARHLPNAIQVHEKVISGGQPEGEQGFRELKELGVKTILSVDGAKPNIPLATQFGLRYVHLPHGYNGIEPERIAELAKAVRDLDGPIYIHCHHGKHRSPAAAAVACVSAGLIEPGSTRSILKIAGTSEHYRGLFESVEAAKRLPDNVLDSMPNEFPELAKLPPMAEAMVSLEHTYDHLKKLADSGWKPLASHPALDPAHEALLLREHFTEMLRMEDVTQREEGFRRLLIESESDAKLLENSIRQKNQALSHLNNVASESFVRISTNCTNCHRQYRDLPARPNVRGAKASDPNVAEPNSKGK